MFVYIFKSHIQFTEGEVNEELDHHLPIADFIDCRMPKGDAVRESPENVCRNRA
jgi:hypothetical protein